MATNKNTGTIRQRADGMWEGRATIGGKRHSVYGRSRKEAQDKLRALSVAVEAPADDITVNEWMDAWVQDTAGNLAQHTIISRESIKRTMISPYIGNIGIHALAPLDIRRMYGAWAAAGYSHGTMIHGKRTLMGALNYAVDMEVLEKNTFSKIQVCRSTKPNKTIKPLDGDSVKAFVEAAEKDRYGDALLVGLFTGLRRAELAGLTWDCVDFGRGCIRVYRQLKDRQAGNAEVSFMPTKNKRERIVYPPDRVFEILRRIKEEQAGIETPSDLIFLQRNGTPLWGYNIFLALKRVAKKIGLPETRLHDLRHSFATLALQNGGDPKTVSEALGHATVGFTLNVYTHYTETAAKNMANKMQGFIDALQSP